MSQSIQTDDVIEHYITHSNRLVLALRSQSQAMADLSAIVAVAMPLLPPEQSRALSAAFNRVVSRTMNLNEAICDHNQDVTELLLSYSRMLTEIAQ
uniref:Uncharacterized protein n=1 Tax=Hot spring virus BHS1 TaxID=2024351 RepID=A0A2U7P3D6_9VIRU|nr:hypothetical protein [Hot spring virus BHS1]